MISSSSPAVGLAPSTTRQQEKLRRDLHHLEPLANDLGDLLVLVLQQAEGERDVVPLALRLAPL